MRMLHVLASLVFLSVVSTAQSKQPNFLIILADDLCWRDLACTGNPDVKTPNIDQLAADGMRLDRMFTASATCSPLRHALYTGLHPIRSGAYPNHTMVKPGTKSIFNHLKDHGYRVGLHNKSHVHPFESFPFEQIGQHEGDYPAIETFLTRDRDQPWFLVFASNHPHTPWNEGSKDLYHADQLTVPAYLHDNAETRAGLAAYYAEITALDEQVRQMRTLLEETSQTDHTVVLFLSEQGSGFPYGGKWSLYDNGIRTAAFLFWPGLTQPGTSSKALMQYIDIVPTLLEGAGIDPTQIDTGCPSTDGTSAFDGRSFLPVLKGATQVHRRLVFAQHTAVGVGGFRQPYPQRAVRDSRFKFIRNLANENEFWITGIHGSSIFKSWQRDAVGQPALAARVKWLSHRPPEELYDLEADPLETDNLAGDPAHAETQARLSRELDAWMKQQGDLGLATELEAKSRQPGRKLSEADNRKRSQQKP